MEKILPSGGDSCCGPGKGLQTTGVLIQPSMGGSGVPFNPLDTHRKPGYTLCEFVETFLETPVGPVPSVQTVLSPKDRGGALGVRIGVNRNRYLVSPGLYAVGTPGPDAEVLVTANYKLTFDTLRKELQALDAWVLVLDTKGVNVWCAAGKKTFSTAELVNRIKKSGLDRVVSHRRLILPQLGATGVSAGAVKKATGFSVVYGPIRAKDIPAFLAHGRKADSAMRQVTFTFFERLVLTPIELRIAGKPALIAALSLFLISGIGPNFFAPGQAWARGWLGLGFLLTGILSGALITPSLLPAIPFKAFAAKGAVAGALLAGLPALAPGIQTLKAGGLPALWLLCTVVSSWLAMNFTGATPFTSPSGVEKEMKRFMPFQALGFVLALGFWIYSAF